MPPYTIWGKTIQCFPPRALAVRPPKLEPVCSQLHCPSEHKRVGLANIQVLMLSPFKRIISWKQMLPHRWGPGHGFHQEVPFGLQITDALICHMSTSSIMKNSLVLLKKHFVMCILGCVHTPRTRAHTDTPHTVNSFFLNLAMHPHILFFKTVSKENTNFAGESLPVLSRRILSSRWSLPERNHNSAKVNSYETRISFSRVECFYLSVCSLESIASFESGLRGWLFLVFFWSVSFW